MNEKDIQNERKLTFSHLDYFSYLFIYRSENNKFSNSTKKIFRQNLNIQKIFEIFLNKKREINFSISKIFYEIFHLLKKSEIVKIMRCIHCSFTFGNSTKKSEKGLLCCNCNKETSDENGIIENILRNRISDINEFYECEDHRELQKIVCIESNCRNKNLCCLECAKIYHSNCQNIFNFKSIFFNSTISIGFSLREFMLELKNNNLRLINYRQLENYCLEEKEILKSFNSQFYMQHFESFSLEKLTHCFVIKNKQFERLKSVLKEFTIFLKNSKITNLSSLKSSSSFSYKINLERNPHETFLFSLFEGGNCESHNNSQNNEKIDHSRGMLNNDRFDQENAKFYRQFNFNEKETQKNNKLQQNHEGGHNYYAEGSSSKKFDSSTSNNKNSIPILVYDHQIKIEKKKLKMTHSEEKIENITEPTSMIESPIFKLFDKKLSAILDFHLKFEIRKNEKMSKKQSSKMIDLDESKNESRKQKSEIKLKKISKIQKKSNYESMKRQLNHAKNESKLLQVRSQQHFLENFKSSENALELHPYEDLLDNSRLERSNLNQKIQIKDCLKKKEISFSNESIVSPSELKVKHERSDSKIMKELLKKNSIPMDGDTVKQNNIFGVYKLNSSDCRSNIREFENQKIEDEIEIISENSHSEIEERVWKKRPSKMENYLKSDQNKISPHVENNSQNLQSSHTKKSSTGLLTNSMQTQNNKNYGINQTNNQNIKIEEIDHEKHQSEHEKNEKGIEMRYLRQFEKNNLDYKHTNSKKINPESNLSKGLISSFSLSSIKPNHVKGVGEIKMENNQDNKNVIHSNEMSKLTQKKHTNLLNFTRPNEKLVNSHQIEFDNSSISSLQNELQNYQNNLRNQSTEVTKKSPQLISEKPFVQKKSEVGLINIDSSHIFAEQISELMDNRTINVSEIIQEDCDNKFGLSIHEIKPNVKNSNQQNKNKNNLGNAPSKSFLENEEVISIYDHKKQNLRSDGSEEINKLNFLNLKNASTKKPETENKKKNIVFGDQIRNMNNLFKKNSEIDSHQNNHEKIDSKINTSSISRPIPNEEYHMKFQNFERPKISNKNLPANHVNPNSINSRNEMTINKKQSQKDTKKQLELQNPIPNFTLPNLQNIKQQFDLVTESVFDVKDKTKCKNAKLFQSNENRKNSSKIFKYFEKIQNSLSVIANRVSKLENKYENFEKHKNFIIATETKNNDELTSKNERTKNSDPSENQMKKSKMDYSKTHEFFQNNLNYSKNDSPTNVKFPKNLFKNSLENNFTAAFENFNVSKNQVNQKPENQPNTKFVAIKKQNNFPLSLFDEKLEMKILIIGNNGHEKVLSIIREKSIKLQLNLSFESIHVSKISGVNFEDYSWIILNAFDYDRQTMGRFLNRCSFKGINLMLVGCCNEYDFYPLDGFRGPFVPGWFENDQAILKPVFFGNPIFKHLSVNFIRNDHYRLISQLCKTNHAFSICDWNDGNPAVGVRDDMNGLIVSVGFKLSSRSCEEEFIVFLRLLLLKK